MNLSSLYGPLETSKKSLLLKTDTLKSLTVNGKSETNWAFTIGESAISAYKKSLFIFAGENANYLDLDTLSSRR